MIKQTAMVWDSSPLSAAACLLCVAETSYGYALFDLRALLLFLPRNKIQSIKKPVAQKSTMQLIASLINHICIMQ